MRAREFLFEQPSSDPLDGLKSVIISKINNMPPDETTTKALKEIEDLLSHVGAGGKKGYINSELTAIDDKDVHRARALLAKYVFSLDMTPEQRNDLFTRWRNDELIDRDTLLSPGKHTIADIVIGYDDPKNPAIKELTDDLSQVAALGQGKGEFLLSVLSKAITKLQKGDLQIDGMQVEVKTQDVGGGRFYDQEVRPAPEFAGSVQDFKKTWAEDIKEVFSKVPATGLKLVDLITLGTYLSPEKKDSYWASVNTVISNIFPGMDIDKIIKALQVGNIGAAKQAYAVTNLDFYRSIKQDDEGILFIDLTTKPLASMVFFKDAAELYQGGMRLHADTTYPITNDPRNAYPQMRILSTSRPQGGDVEAPTPVAPKQKPIAKTPNPVKVPKTTSLKGTTLKPDQLSPGVQNQKRSLKVGEIPMGSEPEPAQ